MTRTTSASRDQSPNERTKSGAARQRTLLIIENARLVSTLTAFLAQQGTFNIVGQCHTGWDCLLMVVDKAPDLVIVDFKLSDTTGAAVSKALKALRSAPAVIVIEDTISKEHMEIALRAGADGYVLSSELDRIPQILRYAEVTTIRK
jgi:DNA-binding NarL/FixJ family response regulator